MIFSAYDRAAFRWERTTSLGLDSRSALRHPELSAPKKPYDLNKPPIFVLGDPKTVSCPDSVDVAGAPRRFTKKPPRVSVQLPGHAGHPANQGRDEEPDADEEGSSTKNRDEDDCKYKWFHGSFP